MEKDHSVAKRIRSHARQRLPPFVHSSRGKAAEARPAACAAGVCPGLADSELHFGLAAWEIRVPFLELRRSGQSRPQPAPLPARIFPGRIPRGGWAARIPIGSLVHPPANLLVLPGR